MGTWGPGNLDNDYVGDELSDRTHQLVQSLVDGARNELSRDEGEYECTVLFADFEMVFALDAKKLLYCNNFPSPVEVEQLTHSFISDWDVHIENYDPQPEYKQQRRQIILQTFNRFKEICARHEQERFDV